MKNKTVMNKLIIIDEADFVGVINDPSSTVLNSNSIFLI